MAVKKTGKKDIDSFIARIMAVNAKFDQHVQVMNEAESAEEYSDIQKYLARTLAMNALEELSKEFNEIEEQFQVLSAKYPSNKTKHGKVLEDFFQEASTLGSPRANFIEPIEMWKQSSEGEKKEEKEKVLKQVHGYRVNLIHSLDVLSKEIEMQSQGRSKKEKKYVMTQEEN